MGAQQTSKHRYRCRSLGWLLAVLLVVQAPWLMWHEATTMHVACASHGELIDIDLQDGLAVLFDDHADAPAADAPGHPDHEQEHEHCKLTGKNLPKAAPSLPVHAWAGMVACTGVVLRPEDTPRICAIGALRLAPKHSPPV